MFSAIFSFLSTYVRFRKISLQEPKEQRQEQQLPFPFFKRNGLNEEDRLACQTFAGKRYPEHIIRPIAQQGWCSYSLLISSIPAPSLEPSHQRVDSACDLETPIQLDSNHVSGVKVLDIEEDVILQFRPPSYRLDIPIASLAKYVYYSYAPSTSYLGTIPVTNGSQLLIYSQTRIPGEIYATIHPKTQHLSQAQIALQRSLISAFADFLSFGWRYSVVNPEQVGKCDGKVGAIMGEKIAKARRQLPSAELRKIASRVLRALDNGEIQKLPVVLCHGDLIPTNIMVSLTGDGRGWIEGLVDWAEAEWLPFGTCLYGLEYFLGYYDDTTRSSSGGSWVYYDSAEELREYFWSELESMLDIAEEERDGWRVSVKEARDMGVILWFGYAWDDGKIDRVVDESDVTEVRCLEAFLRAEESSRI